MPHVGVPFFAQKKDKARVFNNKIDLHEYLKIVSVTDRKFDEPFKPEVTTVKLLVKDKKSKLPKEARDVLSKTLQPDDLAFHVEIKKSGKVFKRRLIFVGLRKIERGFLKGNDTPRIVGVWDFPTAKD